MRKDLFMDNRELAMQRAHQRHQLRIQELDKMRLCEDSSVIMEQGCGCGNCLVVGRSVPSANDPVDCCFKSYSYLPIHLDLNNQRPNWCPGFERNEEIEKVEVKSETNEQQELFGFRRD